MSGVMLAVRPRIEVANDTRPPYRKVKSPSGRHSHYESHRDGQTVIAVCGVPVGRTVVSTDLGEPSCSKCRKQAGKELSR